MPAGLRPIGHRAIKALSSQSRALTVSSSLKEVAKDTKPTTKDPPKGAESTAPSAESESKKTMAELDEELKLKLEGISGEGGASGLEYENGKAVAMKRSVKSNMFRLI